MPDFANDIPPAATEIDSVPSIDRDSSQATECWHFDALSDDGREAIVITFNANYAFSPRYFRSVANGGEVAAERFPAVTFTYSVDGKIVLRAVNEFRADEFSADEMGNHCAIARSSCQKNSAEYGSGFVLDIDLLTPRKCRLKAELEWLSIETAHAGAGAPGLHEIVASRSDVSGRITRIGRRGSARKVFHFRGTGYHDHFRTDGQVEKTISSTLSGRAHFVDSTAIFACYGAKDHDNVSRMIIVRDGVTIARTVKMEFQNFRRDRYGLVFPGRILFVSDDNLRLRVKPLQAVESGFFKKVMTSEITLMLGDGKPRKTTGIVEFTEPARLKNGLLRWLSGLRIGRNGRSPLF